jgi:lysophospholipase L1-like esterase
MRITNSFFSGINHPANILYIGILLSLFQKRSPKKTSVQDCKMSKKKITIGMAILLLSLGFVAFLILSNPNKKTLPETIRVACVGDSLTQSSGYPYELWKLFGSNAPYTIDDYPLEPNSENSNNGTNYAIGNFGAGSTTILLTTETPYMNTSLFQNALDYEPNIVVIMLGTNDAQPNLEMYNASFVADYMKLVSAFQALTHKPKIWLVLPPPIFSNQSGKIDPEYFKLTIIPNIKEVAVEMNLPLIDVYAALFNHPDYFPDGVHPSLEAAKIIASTVYEAIT